MSLFTQNWSFNSAHLCLSLTTGSLYLRTWRPLKTHHCALKKKKRKRGVSVLDFKCWQISQNSLFFTTHAVYKNRCSLVSVRAVSDKHNWMLKWAGLQRFSKGFPGTIFSGGTRVESTDRVGVCCLHSWTELSTDPTPLYLTIKVKFTLKNSYSKMQLTNFSATNITQVIHIHFWWIFKEHHSVKDKDLWQTHHLQH